MMAGRVACNISLNPELADYLQREVQTGQYGSVSEVVRAALRHFATISTPTTTVEPKDISL
jgi:putative addiction module CopG family antidote